MIDHFLDAGATVVALSRVRHHPVSRPVDINRTLRQAGLLEVYTQDGMEYLDPWTSHAFAVADHQVAHVYVRTRTTCAQSREILVDSPAWTRCSTPRASGARPRPRRSGELVAVAEPDAWFTYYYWLDDDRAPDFARQVEIHRKPGYDPAELFLDHADPGETPRGRQARPQEARVPLPPADGPAGPLGRPRQPRPPPDDPPTAPYCCVPHRNTAARPSPPRTSRACS